MKTSMMIHLSTGNQILTSTENLMVIPRLGENIKNHKGVFEIVKDVTYAYIDKDGEGLVIHVYT